MDLSKLTNEQLMAIAGPPSAAQPSLTPAVNIIDPSDLSNEDLMAIAGPPTESAPKAPPMGAAQTFAGGMSDLLNKFAFGAGDEIIGAGNAIVDDVSSTFGKFTGLYDRPAGNYEQRKEEARALREGYAQQNPRAALVNNAAGIAGWAPKFGAAAALGAGKVLQGSSPASKSMLAKLATTLGVGAAEGGTIGGISGFVGEDGTLSERTANAAEEALKGAAVGSALTGVLKGGAGLAGKVADNAPDWSRKATLRAYGATKSAINKAVKRMPEMFDESGDFVNPITKAIQSFQQRGGGLGDMSGPTLIKELDGQIDEISGTLTRELTEAQKNQKDAITPVFAKTQQYINGLAGTDKQKAMKIAEEEMAATLNATDGTLLSIQQEKERLGTSIAESAWGEDVAGRLRNNILKRIRSDLRTAVEDNYSVLSGKPAELVKDLNDEIGKRLSLKPLFNDLLTSDESGDVVTQMLQVARTSGGVGQTIVGAMAGFGAGGIPLAVGAPLAALYAQTPNGRRAIGQAFASPRVQKAAELADALAGKAPNLTGMITRGTDRDAAPAPIPAQPQEGIDTEIPEELPEDLALSLMGAEDTSAIETVGSRNLAAELAAQLFAGSASPNTLKALNQNEQAARPQPSQPETLRVPNPALIQAGRRGAPTQGTIDPAALESVGASPQQATDLAQALLQPASLRTMAGGQEMSTTKPKAPQAKQAPVGDVDLTPRRVDPALVDAVIMQESAGKANAVGPRTKYGNAKGLMQLLDSTGKEWHKKLALKGEYDPFNAQQNKTIGTAYLDNLTARYKGSVPLALAAYNWGMGNLDRALDGIGSKLPKAIDAELERTTIQLIQNGMSERDAKRVSMAQAVDKYGPSILEGVLPSETRNYVRKIMTNYNKKRGAGLVEV